MIWRFCLVLVMIGCAVVVTGCETPETTIKPRGTVAVTPDAANQNSRVAVELANLLTITLPPAQPGLVWQIAYHDTRFLKQHSNLSAPASAEAGSTISFVAVAPGATRLRFLLVPAAAGRAVDPVDQQEIVVTIR